MEMESSSMRGSPDPSESSFQTQIEGEATRTQSSDSEITPSQGSLTGLHHGNRGKMNYCDSHSKKNQHPQQQFGDCAEIINGLQRQIAELEALVKRQKRTITHQSKAISDPRVHRKVVQPAMSSYPLTPQHPGPSMVATPTPFHTPHSGFSQSGNPQSSSIYDRPPPIFGPLVSTSKSVYPLEAPASGTDPFGPSVQSIPMHLPDTDPRDKCKCPHICDLFDSDVAISELSARFRDLWHHVENWAYTHANIPCIRKDSTLEPQTKEYIMSLADRSQASSLLGTSSTRHSLVAKAINFYLVREIFHVNIARAFDTQASQEISEIQKQLTAADNAFLVRQLAVLAMMARTKSVMEHPGFAAFYQERCNMHVAKLWQYVGPLANDSCESYQQTWQDLSKVVGEAQLLATDMYLAPFEYNFDFPGLNEPFDPTTMVNHDMYIRGNPQGLRNNDFRVRLGVTPITRIRNISVSPAEVKLVNWAGVLLKPAPRLGRSPARR